VIHKNPYREEAEKVDKSEQEARTAEASVSRPWFSDPKPEAAKAVRSGTSGQNGTQTVGLHVLQQKSAAAAPSGKKRKQPELDEFDAW
jgi:hypothetical protein